MQFIILDIEATCWETEREAVGKTQEIIEIGAVKVDEDGEIVGRFCEFVRPTVHSQISDFCQKLTSITQVNVNQAKTYPFVIEQFKRWIGIGTDDEDEYLLCSWGFFDQRILSRNCLLHKLDDAWTKTHINLKEQYPRIKGLRRTLGLRRVVEDEGFEFEGLHHRGIDDAINLSKIFVKYMHQWAY